MLEHELDIPKDYVIKDRPDGSPYGVSEEMITFPKDMPSAFVCNCDLTAAYVISRLKKDGYRVPEDISVVGFDNYLYPGICDVNITTYEVDMALMAKSAIDRICQIIEGTAVEKGIAVVEGQLIIRDSAGPLKQ